MLWGLLLLSSSLATMSTAPPPGGMPHGAAMWEQRYGAEEYAYGKAPNDFLNECAPKLAQGSRILCIAEGEGRNAVFLATQGHTVTAVDMSAAGIAKVEKLAAENGVTDKISAFVKNLADYDLGTSEWDAIVSIFCHLPPPLREKVHKACVVALKPGGKLILEGYTPAQLELKTGGPPVAEMMFSKEQNEKDFEGLKVIRNEELVRDVVEGIYHTGKGAVVQLFAEK
mmetsp:Transcript_27760/g.54278  ORF Transcript_27760/g.54278 Transcript_27760/m.54278 type:complete len:227 (-) Transcript_27760:40-720(-)